MDDIVIIGAGNFGREVAQLIEDINSEADTWNLLGFIDETPGKQGEVINGNIVLGGFDWLYKNLARKLNAVCAIGNPKDKRAVVQKAGAYRLTYVNLVHPDARVSRYVEMGAGNIICCNSLLSVNTRIGNHVAINPGCGIGHDATIDDYATLYWNVTLSGNVHIKEGCELGSKSVVIPKKIVGSWSVIGAGAVVIKDIPGNCTAVGVPAKPLYKEIIK